jgi:pyruvate/2-oxoglutarate dehydrogenase complex dihydrolipoamide acyltransferase (E2) component
VPDVTLPRLADTHVEGTVARWLKRPGERVALGEPLVEIETDKVNSELESPYEGLLTEIVAPEGTTVPVGEVIARIEEGETEPGQR